MYIIYRVNSANVQENIIVIRPCRLQCRRGSFTSEDHVGFAVNKVVDLTGADFCNITSIFPCQYHSTNGQ